MNSGEGAPSDRVADLIRFDGHVHSRYSDGTSDPRQNLSAAQRAGLRGLVMADHVRADTTWLPGFVAAVGSLRPETSLDIAIGVESKMLDTYGALDLPARIDRVDRVLIADHQLPTPIGPATPGSITLDLAAGRVGRREVIGWLLDGLIAAVTASPLPAVVVHPFSLLPKLGLDETDLDDGQLQRLIARCQGTGTAVEVNEKWACPSATMVRAFADGGVAIVVGSDAHDAGAVGLFPKAAVILDAAYALATGSVPG